MLSLLKHVPPSLVGVNPSSKNQAIPIANHTNNAILQANAQYHTHTIVHTSDNNMSSISVGEGNKLETTQVTRQTKTLRITTREESQVKPASHTLVQGIETEDVTMIGKLEISEERSKVIESEGCPQGFHRGDLV